MLNKRAVYSPKLTRNPEGKVAYDLTGSELALFTMASGLKLEKDFYYTPQAKLDEFGKLLDSIGNVRLISAYAYFLSQYLGIKLSPVIMLTHVAIKRQRRLSHQDRRDIELAVYGVFDRPDKFANAFGYAKYLSGGNAKRMPPFYKRLLRDAFERMSEKTLIKNKLQNREIKTADLIKLLHPRPKNDRISNVYKSLIENDREVIARDETDMVRVLSSKATKAEKDAVISDNLENTSINALIRNLRNVLATDRNVGIIEKRFNEVLKVSNGIPEIRVVDPFDLLSAGLMAGKSAFADVIDKALYKFMSGVNTLDGKRVTVLVDISGSMSMSDTEVVAQYLALLSPALQNADVEIRKFGSTIRKDDKAFTNAYKLNKSLVSNYGVLRTQLRNRNEGTRLADAVKIAANSNPDLIIVFSDEVTWQDRYNNGLSDKTLISIKTPILAINPRPQAFTAFDPQSTILRIGSLDAKIFYYMPLLSNPRQFNNWVVNLLHYK